MPDDDKREVIINGVAANLSEEEKVQLFILSPFGKRTWKLVDALSEAAQANYWSAVTPDWLRDNDAENEAVERLLKATRPRAAFSCVSNHPERLDAQVLFRVLSEMAQGGNDQPGQYTLQHYYVEKAFKHLSSSPVLALDEKAGLEFAYIDVLARPRDRRDSYGNPNLERYIEAHPEFVRQSPGYTSARTVLPTLKSCRFRRSA